MFILTLPATFNVGDTATVKVNGRDTTVTYTDSHTLTLGSGETRTITYVNCNLDESTFVCAEDGVVILPVANDTLVDDNPF